MLLLTVVLALNMAFRTAYSAAAGEQKRDEKARDSSGHETIPDSGLPGRMLVQQQCTRCHSEPQPNELPKELWPSTLLSMGLYLGLHGDEFPDFKMDPHPLPKVESFYSSYAVVDARGEQLEASAYTPFILPTPLISKAEMGRIREYMVSNAPTWDEMRQRWQNLPELRHAPPTLDGFTPTVPKLEGLQPNQWILSLAVDAARRRLYVGRAIEKTHPADWRNDKADEAVSKANGDDELLAFDLRSGKRLGRVPTGSNPIHLETTAGGVRLSTYGGWPPVIGKGRSQVIDWEFDGGHPRGRMLVNGQQLIIDHNTQDMNGDGLADIVLNAYADGIFNCCNGQLAVYWQTPEYRKLWPGAPAKIPVGELAGALRKTVLLEQSGIIDNLVADFNQDGKPDIAVLVAQAKQQVIVFSNNGNETFTPHVVAQWGPSFGGISIGAADFDGDGKTDIVVLDGDGGQNGVPTGTKTLPHPFHGVRILGNNGDTTFTERFYYPMDGATRSVIGDFDGDGRPDIAAISLFPDWNEEEPRTFVYLGNKGNWRFQPAQLPREYFSIWTSITAADVDADGVPDIVLGLGNYPSMVPADWTTRPIMKGRNGNAPSVLFLLNNHRLSRRTGGSK